MNRFPLKTVGMSALTLIVSVALIGCEPKGPAEKAGENLDKAGTNIKNAVDPRGPAEKVGDKIDNAVGNK